VKKLEAIAVALMGLTAGWQADEIVQNSEFLNYTHMPAFDQGDWFL